jgi:hypothetical protein
VEWIGEDGKQEKMSVGEDSLCHPVPIPSKSETDAEGIVEGKEMSLNVGYLCLIFPHYRYSRGVVGFLNDMRIDSSYELNDLHVDQIQRMV